MDQEKTYRWVQDRLRELHSGTIAEADRHKLAALAKENPFVADALEGFELYPHINHAEHLESLTHRITGVKRVRRRWLIPNLTVTAVAASLILIVGFWAVMSRLSSDEKQEESVAVSEYPLQIETYGDSITLTPVEDSAIASAEPSRAKTIVDPPTVQIKPSGPYTTTSKDLITQVETTEQPGSTSGGMGEMSFTVTEVAADKDEKTTDQLPTPPAYDEASEISRPYTTSNAAFDPGMTANQMDPNLMRSRATGRILSLDGNPLIGVNVVVRGSNQVTISDDDGKFEVFLPRPESEVDVFYSGYEDASIMMKQGEENKEIRLNNQPLYDVAAVVGKGGRNRKMMQEAVPVMDTINFDAQDNLLFIDYLKKNSKYPIADSTFNAAKMVTLDFLVDAKGKPDQITIYQTSYNTKMDEEAIRLIKKGPDWECLNSNSICRARYSIYFR